MTASARSVAELVVEFLIARSVDRVFGLQGGHIRPNWDQLAQRNVRIIDVRDEGAAVHMAHANAVLTGQLGVVLATAGPGVTIYVTAVKNAQTEQSMDANRDSRATADRQREPSQADSQAPHTRYRSIIVDSARWDGFAFRPGDIVISTPPKSGTTWTQMLCALLIFDGPDFPAPLDEVSPGLDICTRPLAEVTAALAAQTHRRFIKTHAPLDGLPLHAEATYLVVGRDPRDVAISWAHHAANMDFARVLALREAAVGNADLVELPDWRVPSADPVARFRRFVAEETSGVPPTLASVLHHLDTGWQHRREPNVALFHYADLTADLAGELLRLAGVLGIPCSPARARELAPEASLTRMRERAADVAPGASEERLKDTRAFFRSGGTGEWRANLAAADLAAYEARVDELGDPELAAWAHGGRLASGVDPDRCRDRVRHPQALKQF
jgi:hypothetical protein